MRTNSIRSAPRAACLPLVLVTALNALQLRSDYSLDVRLAGTAGVQVHEPSGQKGFAGAVGYLSFRYALTERVFARVAVRGSEAMGRPFIHEGLIGRHRGGFELEGGLLRDRVGPCRVPGARSFVSSPFEDYVLWDTYGAGIRLSQAWGPMHLGGSVTINSLESGSAHLAADFGHKALEARLLAGFQTYDIEQQDNLIVCGGEWALSSEQWGVHAVAMYERYLGYGSATNPTMRPGWLVDGYLEAFVAPIVQMRLSGLVRYTRYAKRYAHERVRGGVELEYIPVSFIGTGMNFDIVHQDGYTGWSPMLFVDIQPVPEVAEARIYARRQVSGEASATFTIGGTIWLDF